MLVAQLRKEVNEVSKVCKIYVALFFNAWT